MSMLIMRTAALLLMFSGILFFEGTWRTSYHIAGQQLWTETPSTQHIIDVLASCLEVMFGFTGMALAGSCLVYDYHNTTVTSAVIATMLTGWITFLVHVFVSQIYAGTPAAPSTMPSHPSHCLIKNPRR